MSWEDRDYASQEGYERATGRRVGGGRIGASGVLIGLNVVAFLAAQPRPGGLFELGVMHADSVLHGEVWRLLTACFLHWGFGHLFFNMLGLFFFGLLLEQRLGRARFLSLYLGSGVLANAAYVALYLAGWSGAGGLAAGASGCIYAVLGACAVLMPHIRVLVFFFIPMSIRVFMVLFVLYGVSNVVSQGRNAGGDAVHLAGLGLGAAYALRERGRPAGGRAGDERLDETVDRLLEKISREGMDSLSEREREVLRRAAQRGGRS